MKKELIDLVEENKELFWDCKRDGLSNEAIVERFLNYAELDKIKKLIKILGYETTRKIFKSEIDRPRINFISPQIINYFTLFFDLKNEVPYRDIIQRAKRDSFFYREI